MIPRQIMKREKITYLELIDRVQAVYPKFSKSLFSMCNSPEKYGIKMIPAAERIAAGKFKQAKSSEGEKKAVNTISKPVLKEISLRAENKGLSMDDFLKELLNEV